MKHTFGIPRTTLGILGAALTTVSGVLILGLAAAAMQGFVGSPYIGIAAFLVLPGFFILGLLLIPFGAWLERRRIRRAAERGEEVPHLPVIDLNDDLTRRRVLVFLVLTALNFVILGVAGYKGLHVMDSVAFCGSCHSVMDPEVTALIVQASEMAGIARRPIGDAEICDRLILPMINEGAKLVEEGIVERASDIDLVWQFGYGWPDWKGGPMYHADRLGAATVVQRLQALEAAHGERFAPAPLLVRLAQTGQSLTPPLS